MSSISHQHGPVFDGRGVRVVRVGEGGLGEGVVRWIKMLGASVWGVSLGVIGLWIFVEPSLPGFLGRLSVFERGLIGFGMLAGGQLVFLICVAERIFVYVPRALVLGAHWVLLGIGVVSIVWFIGVRVL